MIDVVVALEAELAGRRLPAGFRVHFCGVGKINAALKAAEALARSDCRRVVNFGTAGSLRPELAGQLVRVNRILQRDMDARPLAALGDTPFEEGPASGVIDLDGDGYVGRPPPAAAETVVVMDEAAAMGATLTDAAAVVAAVVAAAVAAVAATRYRRRAEKECGQRLAEPMSTTGTGTGIASYRE